MISLSGIVDAVTGPFKPMYAIKPSLADAQDAAQPYKLYRANMFGAPKPKIAGFSHKYAAEQVAHTILSCLKKGSKVYILQEKIILGDQPGEAPKNQEEIARHIQWKNDLLHTLQAQSPKDVSYEIVKDTVRLYGTRSSPTKKESYNQIIQHKRKV